MEVLVVLAAVLGIVMGGAVLFGAYFLPTIIAFKRGKRNRGAILALNLLLGWTVLGWVISLVWALSVDE